MQSLYKFLEVSHNECLKKSPGFFQGIPKKKSANNSEGILIGVCRRFSREIRGEISGGILNF